MNDVVGSQREVQPCAAAKACSDAVHAVWEVTENQGKNADIVGRMVEITYKRKTLKTFLSISMVFSCA